MGKTVLFSLVIVLTGLFNWKLPSQTTDFINYKTVVHPVGDISNIEGEIVLRISIKKSMEETCEPVYVEFHTPKTEKDGTISLKIGNGANTNGEFKPTVFKEKGYFLILEAKTRNESGFELIGAQQII